MLDAGATTRGILFYKIGLATEPLRAIDLSYRACDACGAGAGRWAWIPGRGTPASLPFSLPTSNLKTLTTCSAISPSIENS